MTEKSVERKQEKVHLLCPEENSLEQLKFQEIRSNQEAGVLPLGRGSLAVICSLLGGRGLIQVPCLWYMEVRSSAKSNSWEVRWKHGEKADFRVRP